MVHLVIHLPREAKLGGPVQNRWMYPIERFLRILKCYVRNRNHPEGCMAEGYIVEECIILCSRLSKCAKKKIHLQAVNSLVRGPFDGVQRFKGYEINGFRFHTKLLEEKRKTQNSGVLVRGVVNGQNINYYGVLTEIVELQYFGGKRIVLFKCDWWDVDNSGNGVKIDKHDYVSVNTKRKLATNEPFVLASQVEQIFYVKDNLHPNWSIVLNGHSSYFTGGAIDEETFQQDACNDFSHRFEDDEDFINWKRNDLDVISTDVTVADDITEDNESESEADDEDLLL
ncbi:hypothetical protein KY290_030794 [Solanum tuberosum]|uniref:DUF4216 domain-containing protein n=1 Tax=Solanum tuberosum TaxID=4113 RepID=A0ABQ7U8Y7_SOLTU|nr:hypothetical protein KY290_030794 [Solanum tuberosum]